MLKIFLFIFIFFYFDTVRDLDFIDLIQFLNYFKLVLDYYFIVV